MDAKVAETDADWPSLLNRAAAGERVVITRNGRPVAELHPAAAEAPPMPDQWSPKAKAAWLEMARLREAQPLSPISSVELLRQMYEDDGD